MDGPARGSPARASGPSRRDAPASQHTAHGLSGREGQASCMDRGGLAWVTVEEGCDGPMAQEKQQSSSGPLLSPISTIDLSPGGSYVGQRPLHGHRGLNNTV